MTGKITLITCTREDTAGNALALRPATPADNEALARLYFASYDGEIATQAEALEKINQIFDGAHGSFYPEASPVLVDENNRIVAAALSLKDRTDGVGPEATPTIYELFTAASRRREGLAEKLIRHTLGVMAAEGFSTSTVHIDDTNYAALALYLTLDFNRWIPETDDLV